MSPVNRLKKPPVPEPSVVQVPVTEGFSRRLRQTPRAVTGAPPSENIYPPPVAVVAVISITSQVATSGSLISGGVLKETTAP